MSKTALITGSSKRLGKYMALFLARMGYDILIHCNKSIEEAKLLKKQINEIERKCDIIECDFNNIKEVNESFVFIREKFINLNLLINNASVFFPDDIENITSNSLEENFNIHVNAPLLIIKHFYKNLKKRKTKGNVINMLDSNIVNYKTKYFSYLLSKKYLDHFTKMLAYQLSPNIQVNAIAPGFILNSINETNEPKETKLLIKKTPLKKQGRQENITQAIDYIIKNDYLTGQTLYVDGGLSLFKQLIN